MARARPSSPPDPLDRLVGAASALQTLRAQIRHLARFDGVGHAAVPTVLLQGETGTGKGLVARLIHDSGPRAQGPFIEVNCAAIPDTLLEAELFGVEAGAFTDAKRAKPGLFEAASGGTLFLDVVAALPLVLQGKCLTAIEAKRVRRVGAVVEQPLDVKLIAATQIELSGHVQAGHFRADLYHRLAVVVLELPPLRERGKDILVLARAFLQQYAAAYGVSPQRLSKAAEAWLLDYRWPGNVRELSHLLERVILLEAATVIDPESLARRCLPQPGPAVPVDALLPPGPDVPQNERERLTDALRQSGGNLSQAARLLGISRGGLRYRLQKAGLDRPPQYDSSSVAGEDANTLTLTLARPGGVETPARHIPAQDASTGTARLAMGWEPKPVAVLAIEATWPQRSEAEAGPYEPWTLASRWEQCIAEKVVGFGGVLLQGSPSLCLAAFGLPRTLEQLPQRAVQAALAIRHLAAEAQASAGEKAGAVVRLAGHLGTLLVADGTGESPRRWLAVGETVALPVELLGHAAPGELLVSAPMARLTDGWVEVQMRPLSIGAEPSDALFVYTVVGLLPRQATRTEIGRRTRTPLLGRARELATLQAVLAQVEGGRGQVVGIMGEPGMGKSRLLAEWHQSLTAHGVTYLEGHCWSYGSTTPYLPVLDLLWAQCGITPADGAEVVMEKVRRGLEGVGLAPEEWAPYLLHLPGLAAGTEWLADINPETLKANTFEALRQLSLHESGQHPLILAVENLHWIEPTSEAWLTSLVERLPGAAILCLATYRPGYRFPWLDKSYATQLAVSPISPQDSVQVVRAILPTETIPDPLAQTILSKAQGNPFFLEEIAQTLLEEGMPGRGGGMVLSPTIQLPPMVQAVLAARIDRLPPEEKQLLQAAAVIGHEIPLSLLQTIAEVTEGTLHRGLAHLQAAEFLYETCLFPEPEYTFKHALTQEVAYSSLLQERRRILHARLVEAIEALAPERVAEQVERLAHHALWGEVWSKAVTYCQQAGASARDRAAFCEAAASLEQALQALAHLPEHLDTRVLAFDLRLALGDTLTQLGEYKRCRTLLGEAEALARVLDDRARLGRVLAQIANGLRTAGDHDGAMAAGQQALKLAVELDESALQVQTCHRLGQIYAASGDFGRAAELRRRNVEGADWEPGTPSTLVRLHSQAWLAWTLSALGAFAKGRRHGEEALRRATLGALHAHSDPPDVTRAKAHYQQALALAEELGMRPLMAHCYLSLGTLYTKIGQRKQACADLSAAIELYRVMSMTFWLPRAEGALA
jgi:DNA-binding NtrC family response regulator/tetratricopeptide (TPR) repeat protein